MTTLQTPSNHGELLDLIGQPLYEVWIRSTKYLNAERPMSPREKLDALNVIIPSLQNAVRTHWHDEFKHLCEIFISKLKLKVSKANGLIEFHDS